MASASCLVSLRSSLSGTETNTLNFVPFINKRICPTQGQAGTTPLSAMLSAVLGGGG